MDGAPSGQAEQFPLTSVRKSFLLGAPRESNRGPLHFESTALHPLGHCSDPEPRRYTVSPVSRCICAVS
eukprot:3197597-Prymnesium_polylepis.1